MQLSSSKDVNEYDSVDFIILRNLGFRECWIIFPTLNEGWTLFEVMLAMASTPTSFATLVYPHIEPDGHHISLLILCLLLQV